MSRVTIQPSCVNGTRISAVYLIEGEMSSGLWADPSSAPGGVGREMADGANNHGEEQRLPLDALVSRMEDPAFASRHRRELTLRETSAHANPVMLAVAAPDSLYVRCWKDHAGSCEACASLFEYFGLSLTNEKVKS